MKDIKNVHIIDLDDMCTSVEYFEFPDQMLR